LHRNPKFEDEYTQMTAAIRVKKGFSKPSIFQFHPFKKQVPILLALCLSGLSVFAQKNFKTEKEKVFAFGASFGFYIPGGDLADRFGANSLIAFSPVYKTAKNVTFGLQGNFIFGRQIREEGILGEMQSENGEIFDEQGQIAEILFFERGYILNATIGKIISFGNLNPNSGLWIQAGVGFMQHKVRIEHQNNRIPQLEGEYYKGYDRLSNGLSLYQSIGFFNLSNSKTTNFSLAFEAMEGFTQSRRDFNFDYGYKDTRKRLDILLGIKATWIIPVYTRYADKFYID